MIDVSSLDAQAWDRLPGHATVSSRAPEAAQRDRDGGVPDNTGVDANMDAGTPTTDDSAEGELCVFGPTIIGVVLDGECSLPPISSYALTCGDQHCERDWCDTEYRNPDGRFMVMGSLYCSETGCACRCRTGYECVRDQVVYCGSRGC